MFEINNLEVNEPATTEQRQQLSDQRIYLSAQRGDEPVLEQGMRVAWISQSLESRGVSDGDMARGFLHFAAQSLTYAGAVPSRPPADGLLVDSEAWEALGLNDGERLLWRKVG